MTLDRRDDATVVTHALAQDTLTTLRAADTSRAEFRAGLERLGRLCGFVLSNSRFDTDSIPVETPLAATRGTRITGREHVVLITILRAAIPFVRGLQEVFPDAREGVISASRDEGDGMPASGTFPITVTYEKVPAIEPEDTVIVADPMLATGSTMCRVLDRLTSKRHVDELFVLSAVSAPEGLATVAADYPSAELITVSIDEHLDDDGFIVPGLGDAGDRAFGEPGANT